MTITTRKRSLVPTSQQSQKTPMRSKNWLAATVVFVGTLILEMDTLAVAFTFTSLHPSVGEATLPSTPALGLNEEVSFFPRKKATVCFSTLVDDETVTSGNTRSPPIAVLKSSILNSPTQDQQHTRTVGAVARAEDNSVVSQLRIINDIVSITSGGAPSTPARTKVQSRTRTVSPAKKKRKQASPKLVRPQMHKIHSNRNKNRTNDSRKQKRSRKIRTLQVDDMNSALSDRRLLSREEERQLTHSIRSLRRAVRIRDALVEEKEEWSSFHPSAYEDDFPTEHQWAEACGLSVMDLRRVMVEGQEARTLLVSANAGLVTSIAKRHYHALKQATTSGGGVGTILTLQDMIQEGNLGLMKAAERFEPERGFRFSTYATYWIRQRILRSISDSSRVIRLPAHVHAMLQKVNKARNEFVNEIGRLPSDPELAHYLEISVEDLQKLVSKSQTVVSLESPIRKGANHKSQLDQRTIGDSIASDAPTPEEDAHHQSLQNEIRALINELAEIEREVLILRFGLNNGESMSISQTALELGITSDKVRLIEARALNKLRCPQRNYRLKDYVGGHTIETPPSSPTGGESYHPSEQEKMWFF